MGMLGAMAGLGQGMGEWGKMAVQSQFEEERQRRIEEFRLSALKMADERATARDALQHERSKDLARQQHEWAVEDYDRKLPQYEDITDASGKVIGQRVKQTGQKTALSLEKEQENWEDVTDAAGNLIGQRDRGSNKFMPYKTEGDGKQKYTDYLKYMELKAFQDPEGAKKMPLLSPAEFYGRGAGAPGVAGDIPDAMKDPQAYAAAARKRGVPEEKIQAWLKENAVAGPAAQPSAAAPASSRVGVVSDAEVPVAAPSRNVDWTGRPVGAPDPSQLTRQYAEGRSGALDAMLSAPGAAVDAMSGHAARGAATRFLPQVRGKIATGLQLSRDDVEVAIALFDDLSPSEQKAVLKSAKLLGLK